MNLDVVAVVISVLALFVASAAVWYARRAARETRRQADAAQEQLRRDYAPNLSVTLMDGPGDGPDARYEIRNDGPKDLDSVLVSRPEVANQVRYPVALLGTEYGDQAELGPLPIGEARDFLLCVGPASSTRPKDFRVRITCRAGSDKWTLSKALETRRPFKTL